MNTLRHPNKGKIIVFDVIETLLDLKALSPILEGIFRTPDALGQFFAQMLQSAHSLSLAGGYTDFGSIARASLAMTAQRHGVHVSSGQTDLVLQGFRSLPPHPDVSRNLERLVQAGFKCVALSNAPLHVLESQLMKAGIHHHFTRLASVDSARVYKPAAAVYRALAADLETDTSHLRMVAAHSWDVGGALLAGCDAAFVARPGMVLDPVYPQPDIVEADLDGVTDRIIEWDHPYSPQFSTAHHR